MRAKWAGKIFENLTVANEASRSIWGKLATPPPPPNCRKVRVRLLVFFTEEDRLFIFSIFKVRIFISTKCQPPPPESNGRPPVAYAKWKYVTWGKKRRTRNTCNASRKVVEEFSATYRNLQLPVVHISD